MADDFRVAVARVVASGNCAGCGACSHLSSRVSMVIDKDNGFLRPRLAEPSGEGSAHLASTFRRVCPGVTVESRAPSAGVAANPDLGPWVSAWRGWATDPSLRYSGSSGGVISALAAWVLREGTASSVVAVAQDPNRGPGTVAVRVVAERDVKALAGSRYAPVSAAARASLDSQEFFVGKPCEIAGMVRLEEELGIEPSFKVAFFCAGTPSQLATDRLIRELGVPPEEVAKVRYRGNGWPGAFEVTTLTGQKLSMPYSEAWGRILGRMLQPRCRVCADGTGVLADLSVGDYWQVDEKGYPLFVESDGRSAIIARTQRGHDLLTRASSSGILATERVTMDEIAAVQPAQLKRLHTLEARLMARRLLRREVPSFKGFGLWRHFLRHPALSVLHFAGTIARSWRKGNDLP